MIDLHSHILFNLDDGSLNIEESLNIIKKMLDIGFTDIFLTPHYINGSKYIANNTLKQERLNILKEELEKNNIKVNLYLGNEIYICNNIDELINKNEILSLNSSNYILIEFPLTSEINMIEDYIYELKIKGYNVILAHPERYTYYQDNYDNLIKLYNSGIILQCNYGSLIKQYGKKAYKLVKYLLKNNMVTYMGTDVHKSNSILFSNFKKIKKKIIKCVGEDGFNKISYENALNIITK